jgi:hypothetical protein
MASLGPTCVSAFFHVEWVPHTCGPSLFHRRVPQPHPGTHLFSTTNPDSPVALFFFIPPVQLLQDAAISNQSSFNRTTDSFYPTSHAVAFNLGTGWRSNTDFQAYLYRLLRDECIAVEPCVKTTLSVLDETKGEAPEKDEPPVVFLRQGTALTDDQRRALSLDQCVQTQVVFRSSLLRRRRVLDSSGMRASYAAYGVASLLEKAGGRFYRKPLELYCTGGGVLATWREGLRQVRNTTTTTTTTTTVAVPLLCLSLLLYCHFTVTWTVTWTVTCHFTVSLLPVAPTLTDAFFHTTFEHTTFFHTTAHNNRRWWTRTVPVLQKS